MKLLFLSAALFVLPLHAHDMLQIKGVMDVKESGWNAIVEIECWALYPEDGAHLPDENDKRNFAGADWMKQLTPAELEGMKNTAETYLKDCFVLTLNDKVLSYGIDFPDFTAAGPQWHLTEKGQAAYRIGMHGSWQAGDTGPLTLLWSDYSGDPMALQLRTFNDRGESTLNVISVEAKKPVKLARIDENGRIQDSNNSSLLTWIVAGFEHIIPKGLDHICFILGLFLLQPNLRALLWQSTAFTIAHSITLGMVVAGLFTVPASIVEPAIALSIAYIGFENLWVKELKPWRIALVFCLGLLHGMGFASVMKDLDIPQGSIFKPLLGFNLGVECGQLTVLLAAFVVTWAFLKRPAFRWIRLTGSLLIGLTGLYWTVERIAG